MPGFGISGLGSSMPFGFAEALNRKYNILQQQADAATTNAGANQTASRAAANLDNTRASVLPGATKADIAQTVANAALVKEQTRLANPIAQSEIGLRSRQGELLGSQAKQIEELLKPTKIQPSALRSLYRDRFSSTLPSFDEYFNRTR